jgi:rifampicin phosphotransferase
MSLVLEGADLRTACVSDIGAKAARLVELADRGYRVPPFFVVTARAFDAASAAVVPERLRADVAGAYRRNFRGERAVAVRSSATVEDGAELSFAGQFESVIDVVGEDAVLEAVRRCWASASSPRVAAYRRHHGVTGDVRIAVIVQELVAARAAGVLFTVDPASGAPDVAVVSAVGGLGASLVAGTAEGETYRVRKEPEPIELESRAGEILGDDDLRALVRLGTSIEREAGQAQDVEWAIDDEGVAVLQSRPITRKPRGRVVWDNSNIVESYPGITLPLTFSLAREAYAAVYRQTAELAGVPRQHVEEHADAYEQMIGLVRGRVYYNLNSWYTALSLLPGFTYNRAFMEQMMGVDESLEWPARPLVATPRELLRVGRLGLRAVMLAATIDRRAHAFERDVDAICRTYELIDLETLELQELVAHADELSATLHAQWRTPIVNDFLTMVYCGVVRLLIGRWELGEETAQDLLRSRRQLPSVAPALAVAELARETRKTPELRRLLEASDSELRAVLLRGDAPADFSSRVRAYLDRFGYRGAQELKLEVPSLREDPTPLFAAIRAHAERGDADESPSDRAPTGNEALARLSPARRVLLRWVAAQARARLYDREAMRLLRGRAFAIARRIYTTAGERLHDAGRIDDPRDVFYLVVDELRAAEGDLRAAAARRRQEFTRYRDEAPPPDRLETLEDVPDVAEPVETEPDAGMHRLRGHGCSAGRVCGPARVIETPHGERIAHGEILVAAQTDPSWVTVFPLAAGILVERGSPLSHSAIVARELGIPAIVGVTGLTRSVRTGDMLEMDGASGLVRVLR